MVPLPEDATVHQLRLLSVADHVAPESEDMKSCPFKTDATSFVPSSEEATDVILVPPNEDDRKDQVTPESVLVYIAPLSVEAVRTTPSAEDETESHPREESRAVHVAPESVLV